VGVLRLAVRRLSADAVSPRYGRAGDAGLDLFASEQYELAPGARHVFGTGIAIAVPDGYVGLVWDRSGLATSAGITTMAGVIDATYRGEVRVPLLNTGDEPYVVQVGDRIAQLLVQAIPVVEVIEVDALDETQRGDAGFGSSGR
jgi:dUTP pyrophosphatase